MQLNSLTTDFCVCVVLLLALHSILVAEGNLAEVHIPVVEEGILEEEDIPAVEHSPVVEEGSPVAVDSLAVEHSPVVEEENTLVVDILEEASVALQSRIVAVHADPHLSHALLLVAVQGMVVLLIAVRVVVVLLVVRMAVPGCSFESPSRVPGYP
jgi:hypothetical protein